MAAVVDEALAVATVAVRGVEDSQVLFEKARGTLDRLTTADVVVRLSDLIVRKTQLVQHREPEAVVLVRLEAEALHRLFAECPLIEGEADLEH